MPNLFSSLRECLGFSQIIRSPSLIVVIALSDMSPRLPIGVATTYKPKSLFISILFIFIISCAPVNLSTNKEQLTDKNLKKEEKPTFSETENVSKNNITKLSKNNNIVKDFELQKTITFLSSNKNNDKLVDQFINVLEIGIYNKKLKNVLFDIHYFNNEKELEAILFETATNGKIYIGPIDKKYTKISKNYCNRNVLFFSFSSKIDLAGDCIYLLNFFPKNELEELFNFLEKDSRVVLLYPENDYGYLINSLIDDVVNNTNAVLVNRSSYKDDLSNVRDAIKELGKYELRKYELERQKKILSTKKDENSKKRLKKLQKFKTTTDYDFTHVLIADYGLNLLQVAPLLPYYDIDPNVVQFLSTGVIDDKIFFYEPSLQGALFPGIEKEKREELENQYKEIFDENLMRISTLPYDLIGLLNHVYSKKLSFQQMIKLLDNSSIKFDGIDGKFNFYNNTIKRDLDILKIDSGEAKKIN